MLNILILIGTKILPYAKIILEFATSIDWTWQKILTVIEIVGVLMFGIYTYEKGESSCQAKLEKSKDAKTTIKNYIRNMPIDVQSGISILHKYKW